MYRLMRGKKIAGGKVQAWQVYLLLGLLATGAYFLLSSQAARDTLRVVIVAATLAATVAGVRMHRPSRPLPWYLFSTALLLSILAGATFVFYEAALGIKSPFPSMADVFFLAGYPCVAVALLLLQSRRLVRDRASIIDPIVVAVGVGMLSWVFLMKPYLTDTSLTIPEQLFSIAYPLLDVLLLAVAVRLLLIPGRRPPAYYALSASTVLILAFDTAYIVETLAGTYDAGSPIHVLEMPFYVLFGVAALHPSMAELSETAQYPETRLTKKRLALLAAASLTAPGVLAFEAARGETIDVPVIVAGSVILFLLVLTRMAGIMRSREQTIEHEKTLRKAAAALVAATDREGICEVALDATQSLLGKGSRVAIATGSPEQATIVAASDNHNGEVAGVRIYLDEYPDFVRTGLLEVRIVEVESLHVEGASEAAMDFDPETEVVYFIPLLVQARLRGVILVITDTALSDDRKATLEALGRESALALESSALAEEIHRR